MTENDATIIAAIASNDISFDCYVAAVTAANMALAGHATLNTCLATIVCATTLPKGFITREAIKEYLATKCGICESTKMRRRTFRLDISGVADHTIPEMGKAYVFDTLGLRVWRW